jgi:phosphatidate cytidylyltransferase
LVKRIITSIIIAPFAIAVFWFGGIVMQAVIALLILIGMREVYKAFNDKWLPVHFVGYAFAAIYMAFIEVFRNGNGFFPFFTAFILAVLVCLVLFHKKITIHDCAVTILGFFYVCVLMSTVFLVRDIDGIGIYVIWVVFLSAWGSDTGAYFVGVKFGRHKLNPELSPKKTIEGAIGGVIFATILSALYGLSLSLVGIALDISMLLPMAAIGAGGAILSIFGDLAASAVKRNTNIKDFGTIFPGHGGVMDRFDSVLFTAPSVYLLTILILGGNV